MRKKKMLCAVLCSVCALLSVFALSVDVKVLTLKELTANTGGRTNPVLLLLSFFRTGLTGRDPVYVLLFAAGVCLYGKHFFQKKFLPSAWIVSGLLSVATLLGISYAELGNWDFLFASIYQLVQAVLVFLGYWILYYAAVAALYRKLDEGFALPGVKYQGALEWVRKHSFFFSFVVIVLAWTPHLYTFFPGTVCSDAFWQLHMFYGMKEFTNHWPYVSTLILGACYAFGKAVLPETMAIFIYVLLQTITCALCYAYVCRTVQKLTKGWVAPLCALLFFTVVPCWGAYTVYVVKDTIYAGLFAWFGAEFCLAVTERKNLPWQRIIRLILSGGLAMLFRNDLIYIALPALLILFVVTGGFGQKKKVLAALAGILVLNIGVYHVIAPAVGIQAGSSREMLSIPFQQIARYGIEYGDELTEEEIAVIDAVLDYDTIIQEYDPQLSDAVKNTYKDGCTDEERSAFFQLWFRLFLRHPGVFFEATFANSFGYWYPGYFSNLHCYNTAYMTRQVQEDENFHFKLYNSKALQNIFYNSYLAWSGTPVLCQLSMPGICSWVLLIAGGAAARKRKGGALAACVIVLMAFAVCVASPVNGALRYVLPQLAFLPVLLALVAHELALWKDKTEYTLSQKETKER